jgi:hypothetical protein
MKKLIQILAILFGKKKAEQPKAKLETVLPIIFDDIDSQIPALIGVVTGHEVEELIGRAVQKATGDKPTVEQIATVVSLYSPIVAAYKAFKD